MFMIRVTLLLPLEMEDESRKITTNVESVTIVGYTFASTHGEEENGRFMASHST